MLLDTHLLALFLAATAIAMIAPGPDMLFVMGCGMRGGPRAGLLATAGVATSEAIHITARRRRPVGVLRGRARRLRRHADRRRRVPDLPRRPDHPPPRPKAALPWRQIPAAHDARGAQRGADHGCTTRSCTVACCHTTLIAQAECSSAAWMFAGRDPGYW